MARDVGRVRSRRFFPRDPSTISERCSARLPSYLRDPWRRAPCYRRHSSNHLLSASAASLGPRTDIALVNSRLVQKGSRLERPSITSLLSRHVELMSFSNVSDICSFVRRISTRGSRPRATEAFSSIAHDRASAIELAGYAPRRNSTTRSRFAIRRLNNHIFLPLALATMLSPGTWRSKSLPRFGASMSEGFASW